MQRIGEKLPTAGKGQTSKKEKQGLDIVLQIDYTVCYLEVTYENFIPVR
jgi:hypothetical protein